MAEAISKTLNVTVKQKENEASRFFSEATLFLLLVITLDRFPGINDVHRHVHLEVLRGRPLEAIFKPCCIRQLIKSTIFSR